MTRKSLDFDNPDFSLIEKYDNELYEEYTDHNLDSAFGMHLEAEEREW
ncbi:MAG: hypothetical protein US52_C0053G0010 [candidate division WS6 bacterium GW2011_GWA2_37_6]|uniref:Uncharacterized protein n=1 Tax=candidate division WS6 bacterium GW2011_GWA2_37_6 TaxID=1619087 RepID=A0A0G0GX05_9BACT|nr:MAG: hypothetical protein US52_C0053G0010 [candidate division WS6 bacterium GW2011_GWA2_37_6]